MKERKRMTKKEAIAGSAEIENLLKEAKGNLASWRQDPSLLRQRLRSLLPEAQEEIFLSFFKKEDDQILSLLPHLMGKEEELDLVFARSLARWNSARAGDLLHQLAVSASSRAVIKATRKAIFQLKSRGVRVKDIEDSAPSVYRPPQPASPEGFLSSIDPSGTRFVWLIRPQPLQGVFAFHALIGDLRGIIDFKGFETSRKKFHDYQQDFQREIPLEIVEADPEYCHGLMIEAAEINRKKELPLPEAFTQWRPLMGTPPDFPLQPLIYRFLSEEQGKSRQDLIDHSGSLFDLPPLRTWFLEKEEMEKYLILLKEASESRLVLTPYQKEGRVLDIYRQAAGELFDKPRRGLLRRRLEEMAYILWKTGQEKEAQTALAAAHGMESEGGVFYSHPFLLELVKRSLTALLQEEAEKRNKDADLLVRP